MSSSLQEFIRDHKSQLFSIGLPETLWPKVFSELQRDQLLYDGLQLVRVHEEGAEDSDGPSGVAAHLGVIASRNLARGKEVFLLDHSWTFASMVDARAALEQVPGLATRMLGLMDGSVSGDDNSDGCAAESSEHGKPEGNSKSEGRDEDEAASVAARVAELLPRHAGMFKVASSSPNAAGAPHVRPIFFMLDEIGGRIAVQNTLPGTAVCNLQMHTFMHVQTGMSYCIAWPLADIAEGDLLCRSSFAGVAAELATTPAFTPTPVIPLNAPRNKQLSQGGLDGEDCGTLEPVALCTVECPYVRALVMAAFAQRPQWRVYQSQQELAEADCIAAFHWGEYEHLDWAQIESNRLHGSCFSTRRGLIRKANLAYNLQKWSVKRPKGALAACTPETIIVQIDDKSQLEQVLRDSPFGAEGKAKAAARAGAVAANGDGIGDSDSNADIWILKPSVTNQANGIAIVRTQTELLTALSGALELREWVLQQYIQRPLLLRGRKFHLRVYALAVGNIAVHVFPEFLALFARDEYTAESLGSSQVTPEGISQINMQAHLTNTCAQGSLTPAEEAEVVRLWSELSHDFEREGVTDVDEKMRAVQSKVYEVIGECFAAVHSEITFQAHPNCFEHFGFDLLVDENWHVWLLEANAEPDFRQTGSRLERIIGGIVEETLGLTLDTMHIGDGGGKRPDADTLDVEATRKFVKVFERAPRPW
eukprot:g1687.t1